MPTTGYKGVNRRDSGSSGLSGKQIKIEIVNRAVNQLNGSPQIAKGSAVLNDPFEPLGLAELVVNFEDQPAFSKIFFYIGRTSPYNVNTHLEF